MGQKAPRFSVCAPYGLSAPAVFGGLSPPLLASSPAGDMLCLLSNAFPYIEALASPQPDYFQSATEIPAHIV